MHILQKKDLKMSVFNPILDGGAIMARMTVNGHAVSAA